MAKTPKKDNKPKKDSNPQKENKAQSKDQWMGLGSENAMLVMSHMWRTSYIRAECKEAIKNSKTPDKMIKEIMIKHTSKNTSMYEQLLKIYDSIDWKKVTNKLKEKIEADQA